VLGAITLLVAALTLNRAASQGEPPGGARAASAAVGTPRQVLFTHYSSFFSNAEIVRRLLTPLTQESVRETLARTHQTLGPYPLDLAKERFLVYVPATTAPPGGYGLLVFVPPWEPASLPFGWSLQLDRYGVIFVTPARAGNAQAVLSRRVPLALAAEAGIVRQYPVDRRRIYVGGFSGGSRVALRIALGFPDIFRGALLNAGADALGIPDPWGGPDTLPSSDLFRRFQGSSRLVYVTGELDTENLASDASSVQSMRRQCVFDVETNETHDAGHELMSPQAFGQALAQLLNPTASDPKRLQACRSRLQRRLDDELARAQTLVVGGRRASARKLLLSIDQHFGGLAAPRIVQLARSCACGIAQP
jgi:pimeloyl-ACP methyl ester carboxylesterase